MRFVEFEIAGGEAIFVVPEHVIWLRQAGDRQTRIGFVGGEPIMVMGLPNDVGLKLQDRRR